MGLWVWALFLSSLLGGAALITAGHTLAGLVLLGLPIVATTALTLLYYRRERREGARLDEERRP